MDKDLDDFINNLLVDFDRKIESLEIENHAIQRQIDALLSEYQVSEEKVAQFVSQPDHFSEENWGTLQKEKKRLEDKLKTSLGAIANPLKTRKTQKERNVQPHWIYVR